MIGRLINWGPAGGYFWFLTYLKKIFLETGRTTPTPPLLLCTVLLNSVFGKDPTVSAPGKGLCCRPTNIRKNDIMYILKFVCTGFLFSFLRRTVPSILSFQLIQIFSWDPDVTTSSLASEELIHWCWLLVGMFQHKEPPNQRKPND